MNKMSSHQRVLRMVQIALLAAIVVVLQFFFASVRLGPIEINFCLIPIVIAGICIGPMAGLIVGAISGAATFFQVLTVGGTFYTLLVNTNVFATAVICLSKTALAGWLSGVTYNTLGKTKLPISLNLIISSAVCPIVNTGIFALGMLTFFSKALVASPELGGGASIFAIVFLVLIGTNFPIEFFSTTIISPIITKALFTTKAFKK